MIQKVKKERAFQLECEWKDLSTNVSIHSCLVLVRIGLHFPGKCILLFKTFRWSILRARECQKASLNHFLAYPLNTQLHGIDWKAILSHTLPEMDYLDHNCDCFIM